MMRRRFALCFLLGSFAVGLAPVAHASVPPERPGSQPLVRAPELNGVAAEPNVRDGAGVVAANPVPPGEPTASAGTAVILESVKAPGPGEFERLVQFGTNLAQRDDYVAAESALRQVLDAPAAPPQQVKAALLALAHMHRRQGALTKAAAIYERFLKDYAGDERIPEALLDLGRTLRGLGVYKLALSRFYNVINSTLKLPGGSLEHYQTLAKTAQFEIAETHFVAGEFAEAMKFYTRLGLLDLAQSDRSRVQFKAAHAQRLQGDLEGAVVTLRAFLEQWPDDEHAPESRYLLAITLRDLGRRDEALATTMELLQTGTVRHAAEPQLWAYWQRRTGNQLANDFFETGDILNAHAIYSGLLELSPEPAWRLPTSYQLGLCYERLGQPERARTLYQAIVDSAAPTPSPDLAELIRMAAWRIEHLTWREQTAHQMSALLDTTTGKQAGAISVSDPTTATP